MKEDMCGNRSKTVRGQKGRARGVLGARTKTRIDGRPYGSEARTKDTARLEVRSEQGR